MIKSENRKKRDPEQVKMRAVECATLSSEGGGRWEVMTSHEVRMSVETVPSTRASVMMLYICNFERSQWEE